MNVAMSATLPRSAGTLLRAIFVSSGSASTSTRVKMATAMMNADHSMLRSSRIRSASHRAIAFAPRWIATEINHLTIAAA